MGELVTAPLVPEPDEAERSAAGPGSVAAGGRSGALAAGQPALEGWGLRKTYEGRTVVDVESLRVAAGEVFALLGPNGAGKSTLFRILALLEPPDQGRVAHFGQDVTVKDVRARRRIASVFQRPIFFPGVVDENVAYGLRVRKERGPSAAAKVEHALSLLGMEAFARQDVRTLSGGELQRVALARAFVLDPEVLFLDEPTSSLDPAARRRLREDLREIVRRLSMTVVLITHDQNEAFNLADRIAVVRDGRIVQEGSADEVFSRPTDSFVAEFMGLETIWRGTVERCDQGLCLVRTENGLPVEVVDEAVDGEAIGVTMRPEDVVLSLPGAGDGTLTSARNHWRGTVEATSLAGPLVRVRLRLAAVSTVCGRRGPARGDPGGVGHPALRGDVGPDTGSRGSGSRQSDSPARSQKVRR